MSLHSHWYEIGMHRHSQERYVRTHERWVRTRVERLPAEPVEACPVCAKAAAALLGEGGSDTGPMSSENAGVNGGAGKFLDRYIERDTSIDKDRNQRSKSISLQIGTSIYI